MDGCWLFKKHRQRRQGKGYALHSGHLECMELCFITGDWSVESMQVKFREAAKIGNITVLSRSGRLAISVSSGRAAP